MSPDIESNNYNISLNDHDCPICFEKIDPVGKIWTCEQCNTKIHNICINQIREPICPMCRHEFIRTNISIQPNNYNIVTVYNDSPFYIYNEILKITIYKINICVIITIIGIIGIIGFVFLIIPIFIHDERVYNFSSIK